MAAPQVELRIEDLGWISGPEDDPADHCAHGRVHLRVGSTCFVKPEEGRWSLSATGLYLLRTLDADHMAEASVAETNWLFPHCGFSVFPHTGKYKVVIIGCNVGVDLAILHHDHSVTIRAATGAEETVPWTQWRDAVVEFTDEVRALYDRSSPKLDLDDEFEEKGWTEFWREWNSSRKLHGTQPRA
jgi:hypothetical protein